MPGFGNDVTPLRRFVFDALSHAFRPIGDNLEAIVAQLLRDLGRLQNDFVDSSSTIVGGVFAAAAGRNLRGISKEISNGADAAG
jgi:hypothetical protein